MINNIDDFRAAMQAHGLEPPEHIEPGKFHRFPGIGKPAHNTAAWCHLFDDGQGGVFGDFSSDLSESWQAKRDKPLTEEERAAFAKQIQESRKQAETQQRQKHEAAAAEAVRSWDAAQPADPKHPYLIKKRLDGQGIRQDGDKLLIDMRDEAGKLWALQKIDSGGGKKFFPVDCRTKGLYHFIGEPETDCPICISEGWATAMGIHEATGHPTAAAFSAHNLEAIARILRAKFPKHSLIPCADDDQKPDTEKNPGIEAATKAALAVGGKVALPNMGRKADFWDLWNEQGADAVKAAIEAATQPQNAIEAADRRPVPLPDLPPVPPFDYDLLPDKLAPWVQDISERLQCPPDYVAIGAMANLAAVIGRKIAIRPQQQADWTVVPNLWGLIVGRPGVMKSPALEATSGPLDRLIAEALTEFRDAEKKAKAQKIAAKLRADAMEKKARGEIKNNPDADVHNLLIEDEIVIPTLRRYKTNDTTAASLGEVLRQNPNGLLVYRDEMVSLLKDLDREERASERGFFLTSWNGDSSYTLDRIGRGLHLHIEACCISLVGGTQPGKLAEYISRAVKGGVSDDGLIQRFGLMVWPDVNATWQNIDRSPDTAAKNTAFEIFDRLDKLTPENIGAVQDTAFDGTPEGIPYLRFTLDALALFVEWRTNLETRLRSGTLHPALESHFAKYRKLIPALALIIHLADGGVDAVAETATLKSLAWGEYLESHARRCYAAATQADVQAAKAILARIAKGDLKSPFGSRDVWRPGWTGLDREMAHKGLSMLVDYGHLFAETIETNGRPATLYHVVEAAA